MQDSFNYWCKNLVPRFLGPIMLCTCIDCIFIDFLVNKVGLVKTWKISSALILANPWFDHLRTQQVDLSHLLTGIKNISSKIVLSYIIFQINKVISIKTRYKNSKRFLHLQNETKRKSRAFHFDISLVLLFVARVSRNKRGSKEINVLQ